MRMLTGIAMLFLCLLFSGCSSRDAASVSIASGTASSMWYPISAFLSTHVTEFPIEAEVTSGGIENGTLIGKGKMPIGFVNSNAAYSAYRGEWPYEEAYDIRAIAQLYSCCCQIVVFEDSGIGSVEDLKGKRIVISPAGSSLYMAALDILAEYGIGMEDIRPLAMSYSEGVVAMRDGNCDAMIVIMPTPYASITELSLVRNIRILPIDKAEDLESHYTYFTRDVVPLDCYKKKDGTPVAESLETVRLGVTLIAGSDLPDDCVTAVLSGIYDNLEELTEIQSIAKEMSLSYAPQAPIPLHPAAERFYRERGTLKEGGSR